MLLTIHEAAERLRVSPRTVDREILAGKLAVVRVRSRVRIREEELQRYVREGECQSVESANAGRYGSVLEAVSVLGGLGKSRGTGK